MNKLQHHFFWKYAFRKNNLFYQLDHAKTQQAIIFSVRCFYVLMLSWVYGVLLGEPPYETQHFKVPLWPVTWANTEFPFPWFSLFSILLFVALIIAQFNFRKKVVRITVFILFFITIALANSSGKINHNLHAMLIPGFLFIFLDFKEKEITFRNPLWFASAIFSLLVLYFLTGFWKVARGLKQLLSNEISIFDLSAMTHHLQYEFRYKEINPIAEQFIAHEYLGFSFLWIGILLELTPIFFFFKRNVHPILGVGLVLLHVGIMWVMQVGFYQSVITLIPLLILSPFSRRNQA